MAKKAAAPSVYRVTEIIGTSPTSWEDAAKKAVETAAKSLRDLRVAEVSKLDMTVEGGRWWPTARAFPCRSSTTVDQRRCCALPGEAPLTGYACLRTEWLEVSERKKAVGGEVKVL